MSVRGDLERSEVENGKNRVKRLEARLAVLDPKSQEFLDIKGSILAFEHDIENDEQELDSAEVAEVKEMLNKVSVVKGCKSRSEFQHKNKDLIAYAIGNAQFDRRGLEKVEALLVESANVPNNGMTNAQLLCTGLKCQAPLALTVLDDNAEKSKRTGEADPTRNVNNLSLTTQIISTQIKDKDGNQLSPEAARKKLIAHPEEAEKAEKAANEVLQKECHRCGIEYKPVHLKEYKQQNPDQLKIFRDLVKEADGKKHAVVDTLREIKRDGVEAARAHHPDLKDFDKYAGLVADYDKWMQKNYGADAAKNPDKAAGQSAVSLTPAVSSAAIRSA